MKKLEAAALLVLIPIMLAACAHPQLIDLGTAESQVVQKLGEPNATVPLADGRTRLVYSQQPFGQECWWMTFSADGRFEKLENVLNRSGRLESIWSVRREVRISVEKSACLDVSLQG